MSLQAKMIRLLQEQAFERVGGNELLRTDVRLIAATHRYLKVWSEEGKFRPDLYYRLSVFTIHLPPLRERIDDLRPLVQLFLRRFSRELGREVREVAPEAFESLRRYSWPGNIRELQSVLNQALLHTSGPTLLPGFLPAFQDEPRRPKTAPQSAAEDPGPLVFIRRCLGSDTSDLYAETHRQVDRLLLTGILEDTGGNQHQAARRLGIARDTLRRRLRELRLHFTRQLESEEDSQS